MKITKKLAAFLMTGAIAVSVCGMSASAAQLDTAETQILDYLKTVTIQNQKVPASYMNAAENYFLRDDVSVNDTQATEILGYLKDSVKLAQDTGKTSFSEAPMDVQKSIINNAEKACTVVGLKFVYDWTNKAATILDKSGTVIFKVESPVKYTGAENYMGFAAIGALMTVGLGAAYVVARKKKLFA